MTEEAQDSETPKNDVQDIEARVEDAMRSRVSHFKEQADSLTFEGVRRLLEEDLGLERFALDVHKRYVKQCLLKNLQEADDGDALNNSAEAKEEGGKSPEQSQSRKDVKEPGSNNADNKEDSPVMGLLQKKNVSEAKETEGNENKEQPSESTIKKSVRKRAAYIKANSEKITMAGLRRLLEEDLKIEKYTLDPYKKLISGELDEVLRSFEFSQPMTASQKKNLSKSSGGKASKKVSSGGDSDSSDSEIQEEDGVETKKKPTSKGKTQNSEGLKKRKRLETDTKTSSKKQSKAAKKVSKENSDAGDSGIVSEDGHSQSSAEKSMKKKDVSAPAYGRRVEHLKAVIKSCGMSVPPSVYKKVKQVPENKREAQLIKELEGILSKEGLSSNPSEKEIKDVKKRKEREKELEGIDMSNIVSTSRRRSTTSFVPPPKPVIPDISESEESEESDDEDDDDNVDEEEGNDDEGGNDNDDGDDDGNNDNQSEQGNEEKREDSE